MSKGYCPKCGRLVDESEWDVSRKQCTHCSFEQWLNEKVDWDEKDRQQLALLEETNKYETMYDHDSGKWIIVHIND